MAAPVTRIDARLAGRHPCRVAGHRCTPSLQWSGIPADAVELIPVIEDPDVPKLRPIVHGLVTGIDLP
ncbi:hypothetical protein AB0L63_24020 [Nocardia sp. NPDC051990]|uniref:hypothetical protein n=1 Tax=Nocardia sp. NPDC051990 TaxID=3155285 RepID=UPI003434A26B